MSVREISEFEFQSEVLESKEPVFVDFYASWCGPCRMLAPIMEEIAQDYKVLKINVDEAENLSAEYGIMSIPCVILFENGKEKARSVGLRGKNDILSMLR